MRALMVLSLQSRRRQGQSYTFFHLIYHGISFIVHANCSIFSQEHRRDSHFSIPVNHNVCRARGIVETCYPLAKPSVPVNASARPYTESRKSRPGARKQGREELVYNARASINKISCGSVFELRERRALRVLTHFVRAASRGSLVSINRGLSRLESVLDFFIRLGCFQVGCKGCLSLECFISRNEST